MTTLTECIIAINDYALAIANDSASDSTLDDMQFMIDCMIFRDQLPDDMIEYADADELIIDPSDNMHFTPDAMTALRAYAIAAFNLRP